MSGRGRGTSWPSRFVRGRARGGGAYRPYFYFRRNGRTIPAGGNDVAGGSGPGGKRSRGNRFPTTSNIRPNEVPPQELSSSFLRPENYAAPENAVRSSTISVDNPVRCPGWRLYFPFEDYKPSSETTTRITIMEEHFNTHPSQYDVMNIQTRNAFRLVAEVLLSDKKLTDTWPSLMADLRKTPERTVSTIGAAMHSVVTMAAVDFSLSAPVCTAYQYYPRYKRLRKIHARPVGFMDVALIGDISSDHLDRLYCVRGCVSAVGTVEISTNWIAYKCPRCSQEQAQKQEGFGTFRPQKCQRAECYAKDGFIEQRSSPYTDISPVQIVRLVENHLQAVDMEADVLEFMDVELRDELVDTVYPGQDIIATGILRMRSLGNEAQAGTRFTTKADSFQVYMQALSIQDGKGVRTKFTEADMEEITMINGNQDTLKLLVQSLAPEVHGYDMAKAGILLSLFGGAGSQLHEDSDINVLLVGDPGVGKSFLLQTASKVSMRGCFTNGKKSSSSSSSSLQQLVASIQGRTNLSIQSGAVVYSSTGHCSIDDVDRLASQQDTLLQVMQTQSLSMPFSTIFTTLVTPTSIVAAANPMRSHYDRSKTITENVRLQPALMAQFHLVFVLLDKPDKSSDTSLTEHIRALHAGSKKSASIAARFALKPKTNNSVASLSVAGGGDDDDDNYDLEARLKVRNVDCGEDELDLLPLILIKKFIAYARQQVKPLLTAEAAEEIIKFYMDLRQKGSEDKEAQVNTSHLEGLIRLTQARARIDFCAEVAKVHVRDVLCIVRQSMADMAIGDYSDCDRASNIGTATGSQSTMIKKFLRVLQTRSNVLGRRVFDFDELKDIARHAGISCGVTNLVEIINMQGFLLKKGPNIYEVLDE